MMAFLACTLLGIAIGFYAGLVVGFYLEGRRIAAAEAAVRDLHVGLDAFEQELANLEAELRTTPA